MPIKLIVASRGIGATICILLISIATSVTTCAPRLKLAALLHWDLSFPCWTLSAVMEGVY